MRKYTVLTLIGALFVMGSGAAFADGLMIRPALFEERINPGQTLTKIIYVTNQGDESATYYPVVRDVESMDEKGAPQWADENAEKSGAELSSWATFSIEQLDLAADQTGEVSVTFTIPANAPNGGFFGMVGFEQKPPELEEDQSALGIGFTTGALVSLRVGNDAFDDAVIRSFRSMDRLSGGADTLFETRIENTGNALIRPTGFITLSNMFGEEVTSVSFNPEAGAVLPGAVRRYQTSWEDDGTYFGRYEAFLVVGYGTDEKKTLTSTTSFWIIPGRTTLIVGAALIVLFLIVFAWARTYVRRRLNGVDTSASAKGGTSNASLFMAALIAVIVTAVVLFGFAFFFLV